MKLSIILGFFLCLQFPIRALSQDTIRSYYSSVQPETYEIKLDSTEVRYNDNGIVPVGDPMINHKKRRNYWSTFGHTLGWVNLRVNH